jgi:hypothetical protein
MFLICCEVCYGEHTWLGANLSVNIFKLYNMTLYFFYAVAEIYNVQFQNFVPRRNFLDNHAACGFIFYGDALM